MKTTTITFPCDIDDTVFFLSVKSQFGGLLSGGIVVERQVDALVFDGKIKICSYRENQNDWFGNGYGYWGETVFGSREAAENALEELRKRREQDGN